MRPLRSLYRHGSHDVPSLNMAAMPDLIFTVLFFFMIVTHMRSDRLLLHLQVPQGQQVQKLTSRQAMVTIYIGHPAPGSPLPSSDAWHVQLNGSLVSPSDIPERLRQLRSTMSPEEAERLTVNLRADRHAPMSLITEVKQALQLAYALRVNYSAAENTDIN